MAAGAIALLVWIYQREGAKGFWETMSGDSVIATIKLGPICIALFVIVGSINHLAKKNPATVFELIEGKYGTARMMAVSAALPGPAGAEHLRKAWEKGQNKANVILAMYAAMAMSMNLFIFRGSQLGWQLTSIYISLQVFFIAIVWMAGKLLL